MKPTIFAFILSVLFLAGDLILKSILPMALYSKLSTGDFIDVPFLILSGLSLLVAVVSVSISHPQKKIRLSLGLALIYAAMAYLLRSIAVFLVLTLYPSFIFWLAILGFFGLIILVSVLSRILYSFRLCFGGVVVALAISIPTLFLVRWGFEDFNSSLVWTTLGPAVQDIVFIFGPVSLVILLIAHLVTRRKRVEPEPKRKLMLVYLPLLTVIILFALASLVWILESVFHWI